MLADILLRPRLTAQANDHGHISTGNDEPDLYHECTALKYLAALWGVRILLRKPVLFRSDYGFACEHEMLALTGLPKELIGEQSIKTITETLRARLSELKTDPTTLSGPIFDNIVALSRLLQLAPAETAILLFSVLLRGDEAFDGILDAIGNVNQRDIVLVLADVLRYPVNDVSHALCRDSVLIRSGILRVDGQQSTRIGRKLELLEGIADELASGTGNIEDRLFDRYFFTAPTGRLNRADFGYIEMEWRTIETLLRDALSEGRPGVNILLHGPPGVGKTELVRSISAALDISTFEIANEHEGRTSRLRMYQLAQEILRRRSGSLVLFDEVEDVFPARSRHIFQEGRDSGRDKAWTNKLLETNPVPAIWVTNAVDAIDPAFIRRFDYVAEISAPPASIREKLLREKLTGLQVRDDWIKSIAQGGQLVPSEIERAAHVTRLIVESESVSAQTVFEHTIQSTQRAIGFRWRRPSLSANDDVEFDYAYVNSDINLKDVAQGFGRTRAGRLALYGPPGTGKSLYARHLARWLDQPLVQKRASDLLSMWVGGTEKSIATMFEEATDENAVLLLDEADTFLQDRQDTRRGWEVSQVNELLTQMEEFAGVFVCATNRFEHLDPAVLRRFDLKIRFDYLNSDQAWNLFLQTAKQLGLTSDEPTSEIRRSLEQHTNLTPGDFATVIRKYRVTQQANSLDELVKLLEDEAVLKPGARRNAIGFTV